jgi:hypothetical protein
LGVPEVTLVGGEAYLREDWLFIVRARAVRGVVVNMTTGGGGLARERLLAAKEAGLAGIGDVRGSRYDSIERIHGSGRPFDAQSRTVLRCRGQAAPSDDRRGTTAGRSAMSRNGGAFRAREGVNR